MLKSYSIHSGKDAEHFRFRLPKDRFHPSMAEPVAEVYYFTDPQFIGRSYDVEADPPIISRHIS
jgi:hypothetical protein